MKKTQINSQNDQVDYEFKPRKERTHSMKKLFKTAQQRSCSDNERWADINN